MRKACIAVLLALAATGCQYVRSAVREAIDASPRDDTVRQRMAMREPGASVPGTIRTLDDEVFGQELADLGFFDPGKFMDRAPLLLYGLEEQDPRKIPVVFVHGQRGSPREFEAMVNRLDRSRFQAWFFHYPSGADLPQLAEAFHRLFLSGKVLRAGAPLVIVAHSVGGVLVREALNRCTGEAGENRVARLVTIASPMGGLPAAGGAEAGVVVIRAWRDLDPRGRFIGELHRRPLPPGLEYHLLFAFGNRQALKLGGNSDGVVPLASQLDRAAQLEARGMFGFDESHTGVLQDAGAIERVLSVAGEVAPAAAGGAQ